MIFLISPAKTMKDNRKMEPLKINYIEQSKQIHQVLKRLDLDEMKTLMKVNDKIAHNTYELYQNMQFQYGSKAITLYDGMQYKAIDYEQLNEKEQQYLNDHTKIVSAFYGLVSFLDIIENYRLEMMCKLKIKDKDLYHFWKDILVNDLKQESVIVDLCSNEYRKVYMKDVDTIEIVFQSKSKKDPVKKLRGLFLKECAKQQVHDIKELKKIEILGYCYDEVLSKEYRYVYVKE